MFGWRRALAQAGMLMAGGLFLTLAGGLLAVAGWLALSDLLGPIWASLSVAAVLTLVALVLFVLAARPRRRPARPGPREETLRRIFAEAGIEVPENGERPPLTEAFLLGLSTALRLRRAAGR